MSVDMNAIHSSSMMGGTGLKLANALTEVSTLLPEKGSRGSVESEYGGRKWRLLADEGTWFCVVQGEPSWGCEKYKLFSDPFDKVVLVVVGIADITSPAVRGDVSSPGNTAK
jgi:hypothetical protein